MQVIQIFTPNDPSDLRAHRWQSFVCFKGKCAKPLRLSDMTNLANEKIIEPYGVIETRTFCLTHLFEEILMVSGQAPVSQL